MISFFWINNYWFTRNL